MNTAGRLTTRSYHHGDLRRALIIAAVELIEEKGSLDFAMIDAARRAGVSSAAPYRHFRDRLDLLDAVADFAFLSLAEAMEAVVHTQPAGSVDAIIALGKAYSDFVVGHPQFYDLMWGDQARRQSPSEEDPGRSGFWVLVAAVRAWCDRNGLGGEDALQLAIKLWSMAHGLSAMAMHGHIQRFLPEADVHALLESSALSFLEGVRGGN